MLTIQSEICIAWFVLSLSNLVPSAHAMQLLEISDAMAYLHSQGVVHGDLKDVWSRHQRRQKQFLTMRQLNILIDFNSHVLIADFGLAMMNDTTNFHMATSAEKSGTFRWTSPECLEDERRSMANDVYAFACVCYMVRHALRPVLTHSRYLSSSKGASHFMMLEISSESSPTSSTASVLDVPPSTRCKGASWSPRTKCGPS
jgi:serine/threonine protein kinase